MKPILLRRRADEDMDRALACCADEFPDGVEALLRALEVTFDRASRLPKSGSPRYARELEIDELRVLRVARFPYLVFYLEREADVVVARVLHERRDVPELMQDVTPRNPRRPR